MKTVTTEPTTANRQAALDIIRLRRQSYQNLFNLESKSVRVVLADLARFCRAGQTTFHENQRMSDVLQGRREVWLRLADHLNMTEGELYDLFVRGIK